MQLITFDAILVGNVVP